MFKCFVTNEIKGKILAADYWDTVPAGFFFKHFQTSNDQTYKTVNVWDLIIHYGFQGFYRVTQDCHVLFIYRRKFLQIFLPCEHEYYQFRTTARKHPKSTQYIPQF